MQNKKSKNVAETINKETSNFNPPIGPHTLDYLEGLKKSFWKTNEGIENVRNNKRIWDYQKKERIQRLQEYQSDIKGEFDFWSQLVESWVAQFPEKDVLIGDVIIQYYCNIINYVPKKQEPPYGALSLQDILDEVLCEETDKNKRANAFKARIRQISLNMVQKK